MHATNTNVSSTIIMRLRNPVLPSRNGIAALVCQLSDGFQAVGCAVTASSAVHGISS